MLNGKTMIVLFIVPLIKKTYKLVDIFQKLNMWLGKVKVELLNCWYHRKNLFIKK